MRPGPPSRPLPRCGGDAADARTTHAEEGGEGGEAARTSRGARLTPSTLKPNGDVDCSAHTSPRTGSCSTSRLRASATSHQRWRSALRGESLSPSRRRRDEPSRRQMATPMIMVCPCRASESTVLRSSVSTEPLVGRLREEESRVEGSSSRRARSRAAPLVRPAASPPSRASAAGTTVASHAARARGPISFTRCLKSYSAVHAPR